MRNIMFDVKDNKNKKALSDVVSTILLVSVSIFLFTVAALTINQLLNEPALSPAQSCAEINLRGIIQIKSACYNDQTREIEVFLVRSLSNSDIGSLDFVLNTNTDSKSWTCNSNTCGNCDVLNAGEQKRYYLSVQELGGRPTISVAMPNCLLETVNVIES